MIIEIGAVYKNSNENLMLLVIDQTPRRARCVVIWSNTNVTTAYSLGDIDSWNVELIKNHWKRVN